MFTCAMAVGADSQRAHNSEGIAFFIILFVDFLLNLLVACFMNLFVGIASFFIH
jgi:hypothetical protein